MTEPFEIIVYTKDNGQKPIEEFLQTKLLWQRNIELIIINTIVEVLIMYDDFDKMLEKELKNPEFKEEYDALEPEYTVIQALIDARKSKNMTQKQLADQTGIDQADISKLERGLSNPTLNMLKRLANGLGMNIKLEFIPKKYK